MRLTKTQKNKLDALCAAKKKAIGYCEHCHRSPPQIQLQWAHLHTRKILCTRWHVNNSFCLCAGCHIYFTDHPPAFMNWVQTQRTADQLTLLQELINRLPKIDYDTVKKDIESW